MTRRGLRGAAALVAASLTVLLAAPLVTASPAGAAPGPASAPEYWFDDWGVNSLWAAGVRGQGVTIAEIDTGVNGSLPELRNQIVPGTDLGGKGDGTVDREIDSFGHGTAMASIMVARPGLLNIAGIAPAAKIMPIAVPLDGTTDGGEPDHLSRAIRYAADHGAKIISMSLGGQRSPAEDTEPCPGDEQAAIFHALRKGAIVVAAVGNTGQMDDTVVEPGVCLGVVSVGAVNSAGKVASFSGRAPYLTLTAPGVAIASLSRIPGRAYSGDGTSQATALTAAGAALVWSKYPKLSGQQVIGRLLATLDAHRAKPSSSYGYGRLDVGRAVNARLGAQLANPVYAAAAPFLNRAAALETTGLGRAPAAAAHADATGAGLGDYAIGTVSDVRVREVVLGVAVALAGLVVLIALLVGRRRSRRRAAARIAAAASLPLPERVGVAAFGQHAPELPPDRPLPYPRWSNAESDNH